MGAPVTQPVPAAERACVESYWQYLNRLQADAQYGPSSVVLVTGLLLATGPTRTGDFDTARLSQLDELSRSFRRARQDRHAVNVCLDDFVGVDDGATARAWRNLLDFIGLVEAPRALRERIVARMTSMGTTKARHATARASERFSHERLELLRQAHEADAKYLGGVYARVAAELNCSRGPKSMPAPSMH